MSKAQRVSIKTSISFDPKTFAQLQALVAENEDMEGNISHVVRSLVRKTYRAKFGASNKEESDAAR